MKNILVFLSVVCHQHVASRDILRRFPDDFMFGSATSAYQIEGAWNEDGRTESIWDRMIHTTPEKIADKSNAEIACDSYHNYKRDVEMLRELGMNTYRFSVSWSRLLPNGFSNEINPKAVEYYNNLINEILKYNITPFLTLYHWDLPQKLQDLGGFANPEFKYWYEDYARVVFDKFGDRVKNFITFNEPWELCTDGYGGDFSAPAVNAPGIGEYMCFRNLLMAHARAYHLYDDEFRATQKGKVGITLSVPLYIPYTDSIEDQKAAELKQQTAWGVVADPIFSSQGGFPKELSEKIDRKSFAQGYTKSRLEQFSDDEKEYVRGTHDFMGINHYRCAYVSASIGITLNPVPSMSDDANVGSFKPTTWWQSTVGKMELPPHGLLTMMKQLASKYNTTFYITENGMPSMPGWSDDERVYYFRVQLNHVLDALDAGINLKGYTAWSLMDNFEWVRGYSERYGMYQVNFTDPQRTRTPRKSAFVIKHIIATRSIDLSYEPKPSDVMVINDVAQHQTVRKNHSYLLSIASPRKYKNVELVLVI